MLIQEHVALGKMSGKDNVNFCNYICCFIVFYSLFFLPKIAVLISFFSTSLNATFIKMGLCEYCFKFT